MWLDLTALSWEKIAVAHYVSQPQELICSTSLHAKAVILTGFDFISIRLSKIRVTGRFCKTQCEVNGMLKCLLRITQATIIYEIIHRAFEILL